MNPPVKYYGSKFYMTDTIMKNFPQRYDVYVEGFGGGASVLFNKTPEGVEVYNDLGENIYSLYKTIQDDALFEELKRKMDLSPYSAQLRDEYKRDLKENPNLGMVDRAYRYLYVNRLSFNGVGGISINLTVRRGMAKSTSDYLSMIERLPEVHQRLSRVIIEHRDILDLIERYDSENTFFYLDPPYVWETRTSTTNYEKEMDNEHHEKMIDAIIGAKGKFLISGYNHPIYERLERNGFVRVDFKSPNVGSENTESLWRNYTDVGQKVITILPFEE